MSEQKAPEAEDDSTKYSTISVCPSPNDSAVEAPTLDGENRKTGNPIQKHFIAKWRRRSFFAAIVTTLVLIAATLLIEAVSKEQIIVSNRVHINARKKWNPVFWFGNFDEPSPPGDYHSNNNHRVLSWYFRNPLHNFTFYVVGIADKDFVRVGRFPGEVFSPAGGWNWAVCKYGWLRLPFISYKSERLQFYVGWRNRGNFGIKIATNPDS